MDWLKNLFDSGDALLSGLKHLINPIGASADNAVEKLKALAGDWFADYRTLRSIPDSELSPELIAEKRQLLNSGSGIIEKIKSLGFGADYLNQQMGIVPIIGIAVVAGAAGLMYYWTIDYQKFKTKAAEYRALRNEGLTDAQAKATIKSINDSGGIFSSLEGITKYTVLGGAALLAYLASR